jgi:hypothetical protein
MQVVLFQVAIYTRAAAWHIRFYTDVKAAAAVARFDTVRSLSLDNITNQASQVLQRV